MPADTEHRALSRLGRAALSYATLGWRVFPCTAYDPAYRGPADMAPGKRPLNLCDCFARLPKKDPATGEMTCNACGVIHAPRSRGVHTASTDAERITEIWRRYPDANIGIATGEGLLVVDVDSPDAANFLAGLEAQHARIPPTPTQQTAKGRHYVFRVDHVTRNSAGKIADRLDTRGDGGYVVVAPSVHPSGAQYRWLDDRKPSKLPPTAAPQWLLDLMAAPKPTAPSAPLAPVDTSTIPDTYGRKALDDECANVAAAPKGRRNDTLNISAFRIGQLVGAGMLPDGLSRQALMHAAHACGIASDEAAGTIASGMSAGIERPREVTPKPRVVSSRPSAAPKGRAAPKAQMRVVADNGLPIPDTDADPSADRPPPLTGWTIEAWQDHVIYKDGENTLSPKVISNAIAMLLYRRELDRLFVVDRRSQRVITTRQPPWTGNGTPYPRPASDSDTTGLQCWLEAHGLRLSKHSVHDAISYAAHERSVDPIAERLAELNWDGIDRLDYWLVDFLGCDDTSASRQIGSKWMISAAARVMRPGAKADHMLVIEGEQGILKSTALRVLAEALGPDCFTDRLSRLDNKDSMIELAGKVIVEMAELAVLKRSDYDEAKSFLSRSWDDLRLPWAMTTTRIPRGCVFAGTVNPGGFGWLKDPTGNRRYWPVLARQIAIDRLTEAAPQLWAEARVRYEAGEPWWIIDPVVLAELRAATMDRTEQDVWAPAIDEYLSQHPRVRIEEVLRELGVDRARWTQSEQRRVTDHLRKKGWQSVTARIGGVVARVWILPEPAAVD